MQQARAKTVVVSGFHSPLEQSVLHVLLSALCPVVVVLARPVQGAKLPPPWKAPLAHGAMAVVSAVATPGGELAALVVQRQNEGRPVAVLVGS
jgi:hypothetical protein